MSTILGELDYDANAALKPGATYSGEVPIPELLCFELPESGDDERPDKVALEAASVARHILRMIADGVSITDRGEERPAGFGDIAVLIEAANMNGGVFRREFTKAGIPVLSEQSGGFFSAPEITVLISLLSVIDNPRQDVPLLSVLRSPLFGFTPDELSAVRGCDRKSDFFTALTAAAVSDAKCASFLWTLDGFRRFAPDAELGTLIREIYDRLDCMAVASAAADGPVCRNNLSRLFELACKFEQSGYKGLHRFISWLRSMEERGEEPRSGAEIRRRGTDHERPQVQGAGISHCVPLLHRPAVNKSDARGSVLIHPLLGLGPKLTDSPGASNTRRWPGEPWRPGCCGKPFPRKCGCSMWP
jgi:ATP-dependent helicase/nuclease subunit A